MDMRNNKRRNVLTHARVNFSQSETSSLLRGGELNSELLLWGGGGLTPGLYRVTANAQTLEKALFNYLNLTKS